jgi:hypothetical protein
MENVHIDDNYIEQTREESPTDVFNSHLIMRDDDPNEEIELQIANLLKTEPQALIETKEVIQNFVLEAFDDNGKLLQDANCQTGTMVNSIYGKLREVAYKHFLKVTRGYDSRTRAITKMYFISIIDGEIFEKVRKEAVEQYKKMLADGKIPLPGEIKQFHTLIKKYGIKDKLYQCIAEWYVEAEVSIDIVKRIQMYGVLEGKKEKRISDQLKKAWELHSNYYIDFETAFLSMI